MMSNDPTMTNTEERPSGVMVSAIPPHVTPPHTPSSSWSPSPSSGRSRSDTVTSSSSTASSPYIQTPQSPSILGVLDNWSSSPFPQKSDTPSGGQIWYQRSESHRRVTMSGSGSPTRTRNDHDRDQHYNHAEGYNNESSSKGRARSSSGLATFFDFDFSSSPAFEKETNRSERVVHSHSDTTTEDPNSARLHDTPTESHNEQSRDTSSAVHSPWQPQISLHPHPQQSLGTRANEAFPASPASRDPNIQDEQNTIQPSWDHSGPPSSEAPELKRSGSSFGNLVRRKIEQTRPTLRRLGKKSDISDGQRMETTLSSSAVDSFDGAPLKKPMTRLKSLLTISRPRSPSGSMRTTGSSTSPSPSLMGSRRSSGMGLYEVYNSNSGPQLESPLSSGLSQSFQQAQSQIDIQQHHIRSDEVVTRFRSNSSPLTPMRKGKGRLVYITDQPTPSTLSSSVDIPCTISGTTPLPGQQVLQSAVTETIPKSRPDVPAKTTPRENVDLFGRLLPHEMKLLIMKTLLRSWEDDPNDARWTGVELGRMELIKLSRVSRSWQNLCFDGQLWSVSDLQSYAPKLHPNTLVRLLKSSRKCLSSLSLKGMDDLTGSVFFSALLSDPESAEGEQSNLTHDSAASCHLRWLSVDPWKPTLPSLEVLDLRGCKSLKSDDLCQIIANSPNLLNLDLKGLQSVTSEVIRTLSRCSTRLSRLVVSRCWNISLCDLVVFLRMLNSAQASNLRELRVCGLKGYGPAAAEFLPLVAEKLVNLEILDVQGCSQLLDADFEKFASIYKSHLEDKPRRLSHLDISGCVAITMRPFEALTGCLPELVSIEMSGLADPFRDRIAESEDADLILVRFFQSCPKLRKIDLEGSGLFGGVTDRLLESLTPSRFPDVDEVGRHLEELRLGYAKLISPEAIIRLIRGAPKLAVLEVDNTAANNAVMREFCRRRSQASADISLIDCRAVTQMAYLSVSQSTRPRRGWTGYEAHPFHYSKDGTEYANIPVVKAFWSWKRVIVPRGWREMREDFGAKESLPAAGLGDGKTTPKRRGSGASWWRPPEDAPVNVEDERGSCRIM